MGFLSFVSHVGGAIVSGAKSVGRTVTHAAGTAVGAISVGAHTVVHAVVKPVVDTVVAPVVNTIIAPVVNTVAAPVQKVVGEAASSLVSFGAPVVTSLAGVAGLSSPSTPATYHSVPQHDDAIIRPQSTFTQRLERSVQRPEVLAGMAVGAITGYLGGGTRPLLLASAGAVTPALAHAYFVET
jgi:hypothetical protein